MMMLFILTLAIASIGMCLGAVALRSRSVATLNFMICLGAAAVIQPWATLAIKPPVNEDGRLDWITAVIWTFIFTASVAGLIYCLFVTRTAKPPKRRKRRRRSRSGMESAENENRDRGSSEEA